MGQNEDAEGLVAPDLNEFLNMDMTAPSWSDVPDEHSLDDLDSAAVRVKVAPRPPPFMKNQAPAAKQVSASSRATSSSSAAQAGPGSGPSGPVRRETPRSGPPTNLWNEADTVPKPGQPKPAGQLRPPRSTKPAPTVRTLNARYRLQDSERQDEWLQKGLVVPRSPVRGSKTRSSIGEPNGSPPSAPRRV